jgi:spore coat polysaccharide biosynthesis protein SpsF
MRKLVCALACRNNGSRLYGKPLQNLDIERGYTILDYMIDEINSLPEVSDIVLAVSEGDDNHAFHEFAKKRGIAAISGDPEDVLARLIHATRHVGGTDIFRVTSESPFIYFEALHDAWEAHISNDRDLTALDNLPDGCGFELVKLDAYVKSHENGKAKHRSEYCSLYIRENKDQFDIAFVDIPNELRRMDIRLTVDYPEDLILCREVYTHFKDQAPRIPIADIINFLDKNPSIKDLVNPFVEEGLKTMYL